MTTATRFDRRMYAVMNNRAGVALYATPARRRAVVGAHVALTAVAVVAWNAAVFQAELTGVIVVLAVLLPWMVATGAINGATRGLLELRGRMLDERQLVERDRVRALAHRLTGWLLLAGTALLAVLTVSDMVDPGGLALPLMVAVFAAHRLMPLWVAGLRVTDEPADDDA
ncbi:hypothetical protein ABZO31_20375 [Streptomyces sp. HUAS MG47]|uniref:hypothetical protein n=1 Tax=Streptomyces solicamelliae TaxID=3231716 RepID=UPI003877A637